MAGVASGSGKPTDCKMSCLTVPNAVMAERDHRALKEAGLGGMRTGPGGVLVKLGSVDEKGQGGKRTCLVAYWGKQESAECTGGRVESAQVSGWGRILGKKEER